jgi:Domain of unknown function (DUF3859)
MRRQITLAFAALIAVGCAPAANNATGSITKFGIYEMIGPPSGPWKVVSVSPATEIPAKQGLRFGVDFEITGVSETSESVVAILSHPPIVKPDGSSTTQSSDEMGPFRATDGRIKSSFGFTFDHPYEIVPGDWRIQISFHDHVVAEKSFHVIAP